MSSTTVRAALAGIAVVCPLALAACGNSTPAAPGGAIAVEAKDDACTLARNSSDAGTVTFEVTNKGTRVTEFYLYAEGDRILGEVENIAPGVTRRLITEVPNGGKYQAACKPGMQGDGIRADFTINGQAAKQADTNALLGEATKSYKQYVNDQADALLARTTDFVNAVKANKVDDAKAVFPIARTYWERIEPVAESFGDLDPRTDARENDVEPGAKWTGFHRLEKELWGSGLSAEAPALADQLLADVGEIVSKSKAVELTPVQLANGAKELLDEVATGKITGEEDRYSHTDLWDFRANVDGSKAAIASLRPVIQQRDAALVSTLDDKFKAVDTALEKYRSGDGYKLYTDLTPDDTKALAEVVDALGEPISKVAEVVAKP